MIPVMNVFLYSKYSPSSKELFEYINGRIDSLQYLCVDNQKIRDNKEIFYIYQI